MLDFRDLMEQEITILLARSRSDFDAAENLQRAVWGLTDLEIAPATRLVSGVRAGGLLHLAAKADGQPVGFVYAVPAFRAGVVHLHSEMLAVLPEYQKQGVGVRLKWAQREEALRQGLRLVTWAYDPLLARNAHLNLRRLGATATEFIEDFYGGPTALDRGLPSDRLLVRWVLDDPRVAGLAQEAEPPRTVPAPSHPRINDVKWQAGWPVSSDPRNDLDAPALLLEVPPEWDVLCQAAPRVAGDWHAKIRAALRTYFSRGYIASDFAPTEEAGRRRPLYILTKP